MHPDRMTYSLTKCERELDFQSDAMDSLRKVLRAHRVPVWTEAEYLQRTKGWSATLLGSGAFGNTKLLSYSNQTLVVKLLD